jgi:hypothetical protein
MSVRPTCSGVATARAIPFLRARKKFVFDSMVVVAAPGGRLRNAHAAPTESASAISAPPCITSAVVHRSAAHASSPRTSESVACVMRMPQRAAKGMRDVRSDEVSVIDAGA